MTSAARADAGVWTESIRIRSSDVDFHGQARAEALCRHFLEAAWNHAEALGAGYSHLAAQNRFWVLSRLLLRLESPGAWGETLLLRTWPRPGKSLFALRDFEMLGADGARRVAGSSAWLVLDRVTRRPQRVGRLLAGLHEFPDVIAVGRDPGKLPALGGGAAGLTLEARYGDIDVNGHVNSARYVGWITDGYSLDFHRGQRLEELEVNYLGETRGGDRLNLTTQSLKPREFLHTLVRADAEEVCRARARWVARPGPAATSVGDPAAAGRPGVGDTLRLDSAKPRLIKSNS